MVEVQPTLPEPAAQGTLAKTPLPHLLIYALDRQLSGTIELVAPDGNGGTLLVVDGQPLKARTVQATSYLGRVLLELGLLTDEQLDVSLHKLATERRLHGEILLEAGYIDAEQLELGLRVQLIRKLQSLVHLPPETIFKYYDGFDALASYGGDGHVGVDPAPIIWTAIREAPPWEHVHSTLTKIGTSRVRLGPTAETARFSFDTGERAVVELLRNRPLRLLEVTSAGILKPRLAQLLVYCLIVTKQAEAIKDSLAPSHSVRPSPPPTSPPSPSPPPARPSSAPSSEKTSPSWQGRQAPGPTSAPEGPPSPNQVARVQLASRGITKPRVAVEETSAHLPPDDRRTPMPSRYPLEEGAEAVPEDVPTAPDMYTKATVRAMAAVTELAAARPTPAPQAAKAAPGRTQPPGQGSRPPSSPPDARSPSASPAPPSATAGAALTTELARRRKHILDRAASIDGEDYFQMLGVARDAEPPAVQAAFFALAKIWHPDRVPSLLTDVKDPCARVFARMSEAHQTLTDAQKRGRYLTLLRDGPETEEGNAEILRVVEAATNFQKAEVLLRRNDFVQAEEYCRKAIEGDDRQADYHALLAWLLSMKPERQSDTATEALIQDLTVALTMNKMCERAHFYRGMLFKRVRREDIAVKDFRRAYELNPRNIDAQREVRLWEMRRGAGGSQAVATKKGDDKGGGLFGKLFKK